MIKKLTIVLAFLFAFVLKSYSQEQFNYTRDFKKILAHTKDPDNALFYNKLMKRFYANDTTMTESEILALLIGFTDKPSYKPYNIVETERLIYNLNDEGKYQAACDTATKLLKEYPLSYQALKEKSYALGKLGFEDSASYYLDLVAKIMSAMVYSGDGQTPETAMFALGPADGQHLLGGAGLSIGSMGSGKDKNGNFVDILEVSKDGNNRSIYFNIQHAVEKMFDGKSAEEMMQKKKGKD